MSVIVPVIYRQSMNAVLIMVVVNTIVLILLVVIHVPVTLDTHLILITEAVHVRRAIIYTGYYFILLYSCM